MINRLIKLKIFAQLQPSILVFIHPLIYQFISSSIHPSISFNSSINQSILHPSSKSPFRLCINPSIHQLILLIIHDCPFIHPLINPSSINSLAHPSILEFINSFINPMHPYLSIHPSIHQFIRQFIYPFFNPGYEMGEARKRMYKNCDASKNAYLIR